MISLAGLSAAYPGYQQAENTQAVTEQNQAAAREASIKLLGQQVLGRAFAQQQPNQPMAPPPGQASVPADPSPAAAPPGPAGAPPAASPTPAPAPSAQPAGASGMPEISLQGLTQRIMATTPQVRDHPEILMAALERAAPLLDRQSREDLAEMRKQMTTERLKQTGELAQARIDAAKAAEQGKNDRFQQREARLAKFAESREGQALQRLDLQRQALEQRAAQARTVEERQRLALEARTLHQKATEILQANNMFSGLSESDRKQLLADRAQQVETFITGLRNMGQAAPAAPVGPAAAPAPAQAEPKPAPTGTPAAPLPGFIKDGWKFKGGDPGKQESWERVGA